MLSEPKLYANLKAPDLDEALEFYAGKLGLAILWDGEIMPGHREVLFAAGGSGVVCLEPGKPPESQSTPVSFAVADVEATVSALREQGVAFEEYDLPSLKTEQGIASVGDLKAAWFKDPGGNLLAVISDVTAVAV
jgi:catechol 2,3-dioxygenase-like lactoylglutathione lyase family enzyme